MEINLYPGECKNRLYYYTEFLNRKKIRFEITPSYFGNKIILNVNSNELYLLSSHSCRFVFDFYLKEFAAAKIYDEYPLIDAICAGEILANLSEIICSTNINNDIFYILKQKQSFYPSGYVLFNMKNIMKCIYNLTDDLCCKYISNIKNNMFANAEFSLLKDIIPNDENNKD